MWGFGCWQAFFVWRDGQHTLDNRGADGADGIVRAQHPVDTRSLDLGRWLSNVRLTCTVWDAGYHARELSGNELSGTLPTELMRLTNMIDL